MNKQLIIQLFKDKDTSRRRLLNEHYKEVINLKASRKFIAQLINKELGIEGLITQDDIKYCRHYFKNQKTDFSARLPIVPKEKITTKEISEQSSGEISWTNPDEVNVNPIIKSKFSNS